jgi:multisubunit Na+/H+ antiporter MnhE subunit
MILGIYIGGCSGTQRTAEFMIIQIEKNISYLAILLIHLLYSSFAVTLIIDSSFYDIDGNPFLS